MKKLWLFSYMLFFFSGSSLNSISILPEEPKPLTVLELIEQYADEFGVNFNLAVALAKFESRLCQDKKNPKTSATGCYQFITSTWAKLCEGNRENNEDNIKCAMKLIGAGGITHWTADQYVRLKLWDLGFIKCKNYDKNWCKLIWD